MSKPAPAWRWTPSSRASTLYSERRARRDDRGSALRSEPNAQGVVVSYTDGDEPGLILNLDRHLRAIGLEPVLVGNLKSLLDPSGRPRRRARSRRRRPEGADGSVVRGRARLGLEAAITANALGFRVLRRGMTGHRCDHVNDVAGLFDVDELRTQGVVDCVLGAEPGTGAFVVAYADDARKGHLSYFKLGEGAALHLLPAVAPAEFRSAARRRAAACSAMPPSRHLGNRVRGHRRRQTRPARRLRARRHWRLRLLRHGRERPREPGGEPAADRPGQRLSPGSFCREGRGDFIDDVAVPAGRLADALWAEHFQPTAE